MMSWIDWMIVLIPLIVIAIVAFRTQKHVTGVAEFMAGGRLGGRYLVCNARGEMGMAVIGIVAAYELFYVAGFTIGWWSMMTVPLGLFIALTGYVYYRYRETRAMTLAQYFEIRYSKSFRLFAGFLGFLSGLINYGIFPAVSARFFVYFCGLPQEVHILKFAIPTFAIIMAIYLTLALVMTLTGGQLTVMITDCVEGLLALVMFIVIIVTLLLIFDWSQIQEAMSQAPAGKSMLNPFDIGKAKDFNIWYVLIGLVGGVYNVMAWQGGHAFNSCAKNAHEAKMGAILGTWRNFSKAVMVTLLAVCAITFLKHPDFAVQSAQVQEVLNKISDPQIQNQMRMPIAINYMLPIAIKGMLCSIMLFGLLACDSSYLHSWGSIFIQDIVLPLRKKALTPKQHVNLLRWAIAGVALFGFLFSLLFRQTEYILMFFALTGAIFLGGAGSVIAGGLYWKKGTTAGAWAAMISGSGLAVGGIILQQCWKTIHPWLVRYFPDTQIIANSAEKFPINGQVMFFWAMATSLALYFIVSMLTCKKDFNMERMLHRGKYAIADDKVKIEFEKRWSWGSIIGIDEHFTKGDKAISASVFGWSMFSWIMFIVVTLWNLISPWPLNWWVTYWHYYAIIIPLVIGIVTTVWFLWGGITDLHELYVDLKTYKCDASDDGTVALAEEQVLPDNYADFVESESDTQDAPKPYPGKPSKMD
ncbi:MAG: sodium:proline symporter [Lentisphaerae bacterium]|nr:sodium:proline symporter [Lentisphaerota bacterium]